MCSGGCGEAGEVVGGNCIASHCLRCGGVGGKRYVCWPEVLGRWGQDLIRGQKCIVTFVNCMCIQLVTLCVWLSADNKI